MTYEEKRASLIAQAQAHIDKGEFEQANAVMQQVQELDTQHEAEITAAANLAALNGRQPQNRAPFNQTQQGIKLDGNGDAQNSTTDMFATLEYRQAFMNRILNDTPIPAQYLNVAGTTTSTTAGSIVPTTLYEQIITNLENTGDIYARVFKTTFPTALVIPTLDIKPEANWVDEDKGSEEQKHDTSKITFAGYKLECKTAFSLFMSQTSLEIFEAQFTNLITEAMTKAIEKAILVGSGAGCPKGILNEDAPEGQTITVTKADKLGYQLLTKAEGALPAAYDGAVWLMTKASFFAWMGLTDSNGQPIARINQGFNGKPEYNLLGRHVCLTDGYMDSYADTVTKDTTFAAMFDLRYYAFNEVMSIIVKKYIDEDTDNTKIKAVMLADGKAINVKSLVKLIKTAV